MSGYWAGRRVFLTGHTGFKGGWLSLWLQQLGAELTGYALPANTSPALFEIARVGTGMTSVIGDVRDLASLTAALRKSRPEVVIHMAAQPLVRYSYVNPVETYATNVMGTVNLLEAVRGCDSVRSVVSVTSDKCYENREWVWGYRENEAMGGYDPYSNSKACAELVTAAYRQSFFNPDKYAERGVALASARAGNVIGGGDWSPDRLVPDFIRSVTNRETLLIRSPASIRPWQHVLEPLSGYLRLAEALGTGGADCAEGWNFGPDDTDARPVGWIVDRIVQRWGDGARWKLDGAPRPHEATYLKLDCSKAKSRLHWAPRWNLETTIDNIVAWHRAHLAGANMQAETLRQIADFERAGSADPRSAAPKAA